MPSLPLVLKAARERKIFRKAAIYYSTGMTCLGLLDLITRHYGLTTKVFDVLLTFLICSFPGFLLYQWNHAGRPPRRLKTAEIAVNAVLVLLALTIATRILGRPALPRADAKSVAVLPFVNMSDSRDDEYFSDGVTEDILTQLSKIGDLKVISRTSIMPYKNTTKSLRQIGQELGVAAILEGSVRRAKDRVRIVGQLIDARTDKHLWAEVFDRQMTDIFAIQSDVARKIAAALKATLSSDETKILDKRATDNIDAYAFYVRGREYYYLYTPEDNERAIEFFRKALDLDPNYALAYAGLGDAFVRRKISDDLRGIKPDAAGPGKGPLDLALQYAEKAVALDPDSAEAYKALGFVQDNSGRRAEGLASFLKAVDLNPNYAPAITNIATNHMNAGRLDEAVIWMIKAVRLQPGFGRFDAQLGLLYFELGLDVPAEAWMRKALEFQPDYVFPQYILSYIDLYAGRSAVAWTRLDKILKERPTAADALEEGGDIKLMTGAWKEAADLYAKLGAIIGLDNVVGNKLALALLKQGRTGEADKILEANLAAFLKSPEIRDQGSSIPRQIAEVHALKKRPGDALDWLSKSVDVGYADRWFAVDPCFESLHGEPRFKEIMGRYQDRIDAMRKRVREAGLDR